MKKIVCLFGVVCAVAACDRPMSKLSNGLPLPVQTFEHIQRLPVNVFDVRVFSGDKSNEIPEGFAVSVHDRTVLYLSKKFDVVDARVSPNSLQIVIEEASVTLGQQGSSYSLFNMMGVDSVKLYDVNLVLQLEHRNRDGQVVHAETLRASKRFGVSEHDGLAAREQKQFKAIEDLFDVLDPQMNQVVKSKMHL